MRKKLTYKSIANRYGYPIYINGYYLYLSDWSSYSIRNSFKENKSYPRYYGTIETSLIEDSYKITRSLSIMSDSLVWILPDVKYRKKGMPEATNNPQILVDKFNLNLTLFPSGRLYIMNEYSNICEGDLTRLLSNKIKNMMKSSKSNEPLLYIPKRKARGKNKYRES